MYHHLGRSRFDSVVDSITRDPVLRKQMRVLANTYGIDILKAAFNLRLTNYPNIGYSDATLSGSGADQLFLSDEYQPKPLRAALDLPSDVPLALRAQAAEFQANYRSQGTLRVRTANFREIMRQCAEYRACPYPMSEGTAIGIVTAMAASGKSFSTMSGMRDTIAVMHRLGEVPDPTTGVRFSRVWQGIQRTVGMDHPNQKIALTRLEIGKMIKIALRDGREDFAAGMAVSFEGALRKGEMGHMRVEDIRVRRGEWRILLRTSKGDQYRKGAFVRIDPVPDAPFNVHSEITRWLRRLNRKSGYMFPEMNGCIPTHSPRDSRAFERALKCYAATIGLDPCTIGTHSLRAGWATEAIDAGLSEALVASHLRHKGLDLLAVYYRPRHEAPNFAGSADPGWS